MQEVESPKGFRSFLTSREDIRALATALTEQLVEKPGIIGAFVVIVKDTGVSKDEEVVSSINISSSSDLTFDNMAGCVVETLGNLRNQHK